MKLIMTLNIPNDALLLGLKKEGLTLDDFKRSIEEEKGSILDGFPFADFPGATATMEVVETP